MKNEAFRFLSETPCQWQHMYTSRFGKMKVIRIYYEQGWLASFGRNPWIKFNAMERLSVGFQPVCMQNSSSIYYIPKQIYCPVPHKTSNTPMSRL
ncbi:hypothetical protein VTN96DRAFT_5029 [Rasamsonia emersonii]